MRSRTFAYSLSKPITSSAILFVALAWALAPASARNEVAPLPESIRAEVDRILNNQFVDYVWESYLPLSDKYAHEGLVPYLIATVTNPDLDLVARQRAMCWLAAVQDPAGCQAILKFSQDFLDASNLDNLSGEESLFLSTLICLGYCSNEEGRSWLSTLLDAKYWDRLALKSMTRNTFGSELTTEIRSAAAKALIMSLAQAGEYVAKHVPEQYHPLIEEFAKMETKWRDHRDLFTSKLEVRSNPTKRSNVQESDGTVHPNSRGKTN